MNKLIAAAIVSVFMIIFVMLFAPGTKRINQKPKQKPIKENYQEVNAPSSENVKDLLSASVKEDDKIDFKKLEVPRGDAASHGMEEKFFVPFNINDFDDMSKNLEERLISISNARTNSERAKKGL